MSKAGVISDACRRVGSDGVKRVIRNRGLPPKELFRSRKELVGFGVAIGYWENENSGAGEVVRWEDDLVGFGPRGAVGPVGVMVCLALHQRVHELFRGYAARSAVRVCVQRGMAVRQAIGGDL